jgi:hypothetical protein
MDQLVATNIAQLEVDAITQSLFRSWDELFGMERPEVEAFQLRAVKQRLEFLAPRVRVLASQMESSGVTGIESLNDVTPLLFQHTVYKSYPISLVENNRFDLLTRWLAGVTSIDLSGVDATHCTGIDDWLGLLEQTTSLKPFHTSGTSGKLSFFPRTSLESDLWGHHTLKRFEGFGEEPGEKVGFDGVRVPCIIARPRHGRYTAQRLNQFYAEHLAPTPGQLYTMTDGTLSADLAALSGRVRMAQAKGELSSMQLSEAMRFAFKRYLVELENRPREVTTFLGRIVDELRGQRVFLNGPTEGLLQAGQFAAERGLSGVFASNSLLMMSVIGGGEVKDAKANALSGDWLQQIKTFTGVSSAVFAYGMTEITGMMPMCNEGNYHIPPFFIPYLLDPGSGQLLPRTGTQTGRFACMDLLPSSYWGGIVSGDKVTIEWDRSCACGRKGAHIHHDVTRYSAEVTGDDKITCAATVDNTDVALQQLLAL